jgi:hypothetical protein
MVVPNIPLLSETTIARTRAVLLILVATFRFAGIACLPVIGCFGVDGWLDALFLLLLFALLFHGKGVAEVVVGFWVVWLGFVGIEAFSNFFIFTFAGVRMTV